MRRKDPPARAPTAQIRSEDLEALLAASASARAAAQAAVARSRELECTSEHAQQRALTHRMASRPRSCFARVEGLIDGRAVGAVVRRDGTTTCDPRLLRQAELVVALGDAFDDGRLDARIDGGDPLAVTLILMRACDSVCAVQMVLPAPGSSSGPCTAS